MRSGDWRCRHESLILVGLMQPCRLSWNNDVLSRLHKVKKYNQELDLMSGNRMSDDPNEIYVLLTRIFILACRWRYIFHVYLPLLYYSSS